MLNIALHKIKRELLIKKKKKPSLSVHFLIRSHIFIKNNIKIFCKHFF